MQMGAMGAVQNPKSKTPECKTPNAKRQMQNPQIQNPKSKQETRLQMQNRNAMQTLLQT